MFTNGFTWLGVHFLNCRYTPIMSRAKILRLMYHALYLGLTLSFPSEVTFVKIRTEIGKEVTRLLPKCHPLSSKKEVQSAELSFFFLTSNSKEGASVFKQQGMLVFMLIEYQGRGGSLEGCLEIACVCAVFVPPLTPPFRCKNSPVIPLKHPLRHLPLPTHATPRHPHQYHNQIMYTL